MLRESNLLNQLVDLNLVEDVVYGLYGDPIYPQSQYIFGRFNKPGANNILVLWNTLMSKIREYAQLVSNQTYLDIKASMKIFEVPVGKYYVVGAFLSNSRTTFYQNQISDYFDCETLSLDEYLGILN